MRKHLDILQITLINQDTEAPRHIGNNTYQPRYGSTSDILQITLINQDTEAPRHIANNIYQPRYGRYGSSR